MSRWLMWEYATVQRALGLSSLLLLSSEESGSSFPWCYALWRCVWTSVGLSSGFSTLWGIRIIHGHVSFASRSAPFLSPYALCSVNMQQTLSLLAWTAIGVLGKWQLTACLLWPKVNVWLCWNTTQSFILFGINLYSWLAAWWVCAIACVWRCVCVQGHSVRLLGQKKEKGKRLGGARLDLPKIRKNPLIEIISINTG